MCLVSGVTHKDEAFYACISVKPSCYEDMLLISRAGQAIDMTEFGDILESGFGHGPPQEVMRMMEEKYGVDHNFTSSLQSEMEKNKKVRRVETGTE